MPDALRFDGLRALVVEDKKALAGYVATLKAHGFEVTSALNVDDAIDIIKERHFHLAWIDLGLDETNDPYGTEGRLISKYLDDTGDRTFRLIVTVVNDADEANSILKKFGAHHYITKEKLDRTTWDKHFQMIHDGIKKYASFPKITLMEIHDSFFRDSTEEQFHSSLNKVLGKKLDIKFSYELLERILRYLCPVYSTSLLGNPWTEIERELFCDIWSRAEGAMMRIRVSRSESSFNEGIAKKFVKGAANVSIVRLSDISFEQATE